VVANEYADQTADADADVRSNGIPDDDFHCAGDGHHHPDR
jgi:hypothetical protein